MQINKEELDRAIKFAELDPATIYIIQEAARQYAAILPLLEELISTSNGKTIAFEMRAANIVNQIKEVLK